jgi:predicted amidohydrolase
MSSELVIAMGQYAPMDSTIGNLTRIEGIARGAHAEGAFVLVLPEYSQVFIPGDGPAMAKAAEPLDGEFVKGLTSISQSLEGLIIVAGMVMGPDTPRSAIVAIGETGVLAVAEKIHLYDAFGGAESSYLAPGQIDAPQLLHIGEHTLGFLPCYDLRFSEVAAWLVEAGATTLVVPAQWVPGVNKVDHWETLLRARAIESQCFVLGVGQPEPHGVGYSTAFSPAGEVLARMDSMEGHSVVSLASALVTASREANQMARSRRFQVVPRASK